MSKNSMRLPWLSRARVCVCVCVCECLLLLAFFLLPPIVNASPFAYVPNNGSDTVSVIDTETNTVIATIAVDPENFKIDVALFV